MLARARLKFYYEDTGFAGKMAELLEIDNRMAPRKLRLRTHSEGGEVITSFEHERLNTFIATIDDLLFSEKLVEELLSYVGHKPD